MLPAVVVERYSYAAGVVIVAAGILIYIAIITWIHIRRVAGVGSFSTARSERFIKRNRRQRTMATTQPSRDKSTNGS